MTVEQQATLITAVGTILSAIGAMGSALVAVMAIRVASRANKNTETSMDLAREERTAGLRIEVYQQRCQSLRTLSPALNSAHDRFKELVADVKELDVARQQEAKTNKISRKQFERDQWTADPKVGDSASFAEAKKQVRDRREALQQAIDAYSTEILIFVSIMPEALLRDFFGICGTMDRLLTVEGGLAAEGAQVVLDKHYANFLIEVRKALLVDALDPQIMEAVGPRTGKNVVAGLIEKKVDFMDV